MLIRKIVLLLYFCPAILFAQKSAMQIGTEIGIPNGNLKNGANTGFGGMLRLEVPINKHLSFISTLDYISFAKKEYSSSTPTGTRSLSFKISMLPVQIGGKFYLFSINKIQKGLYVSGELGVQVLTGTVQVNGINESPPNETDFSYAPGIGYRSTHWDLSYRQQFATSNGYSGNYSGFRLAYIFQKNYP